MLFRTCVANGRPAPNALTKYAAKRWRQDFRGYLKVKGNIPKIFQDIEARKYLHGRDAAGSCLAEDTILCRRSPSKSTLCEELLHALQLRSGLYNQVVGKFGNGVATLVMEYLAAYVLVKNEARWHILPLERRENRMRLRRFSCSIVASIGGLPWRLRLKLLASADSLGLTLESWMGSYLRAR